jgi:hypothetical protein
MGCYAAMHRTRPTIARPVDVRLDVRLVRFSIMEVI